MIHRDLKPSNVLLALDGPQVIDFGISQSAEGTDLTRTGMTVGSPGYMSPEQIAGDRVTGTTDVFSLGAVLAFAAAGSGPFGSGPTPALLYRVIHQQPQLDAVPSDLMPLVGRAWRRIRRGGRSRRGCWTGSRERRPTSRSPGHGCPSSCSR